MLTFSNYPTLQQRRLSIWSSVNHFFPVEKDDDEDDVWRHLYQQIEHISLPCLGLKHQPYARSFSYQLLRESFLDD